MRIRTPPRAWAACHATSNHASATGTDFPLSQQLNSALQATKQRRDSTQHPVSTLPCMFLPLLTPKLSQPAPPSSPTEPDTDDEQALVIRPRKSRVAVRDHQTGTRCRSTDPTARYRKAPLRPTHSRIEKPEAKRSHSIYTPPTVSFGQCACARRVVIYIIAVFLVFGGS